MPVIAVVAAYVAVSAAIATTTIFTVIAAVGAVITAVGAITNNQKLMKIGAVIGIVGAIGGFASGAFAGASDGGMSGAGLDGAAGDAASGTYNVGGTDGGVSSGLDGAAGDAGSNTFNTGGGMLNAPVEAPSVVPPAEVAPVASAPTDTNAVVASPTASQTATGTATDATQSLAPVTGTTAPVDPTITDPTSSFINPNNAAAGQNVSSSLDLQSGGGGAISGAAKAPAGAFDKLTDMFSGLGKFVKDNKDLSGMILSGIQSAADPSQRDLREAQTANLNANAAATNQLRENGMRTNRVDYTRLFKPPTSTGMLTPPRRG